MVLLSRTKTLVQHPDFDHPSRLPNHQAQQLIRLGQTEGSQVMATCDEIEEALACMECCDALETHLEYCEPDDCGVFETYWRTRYRVEAGVCDDWLAPDRAAMVVMMTAEPWMHEHHDHRIVHDDPATLDVTDQGTQPALARVDGISEARGARPAGPLTAERMADLAPSASGPSHRGPHDSSRAADDGGVSAGPAAVVGDSRPGGAGGTARRDDSARGPAPR